MLYALTFKKTTVPLIVIAAFLGFISPSAAHDDATANNHESSQLSEKEVEKNLSDPSSGLASEEMEDKTSNPQGDKQAQGKEVKKVYAIGRKDPDLVGRALNRTNKLLADLKHNRSTIQSEISKGTLKHRQSQFITLFLP